MGVNNNMTRYVLAEGTQVREEDFGLLFYTRSGPRLYFISCGGILDESFFYGEMTLMDWMKTRQDVHTLPDRKMNSLLGSLEQLTEKGVIHEC
ncbi:MAG: hypothetical protein HOK67_11450 [Deltaproteobacteria bacterium]|jgi:putative mycofactocin binding protein MftB|nr:hypothetical protein [Deltaproteobacteria bacterium]MBT4639150.1 hypothetical protein [Deltaproteobacteria bacterium]MBT6500509.1 hypothetical protein [Deltaproteobacteria bacterium]MBT7712746.1 hypothetical protein [Deltaproteobacteria bacterium]